MADLNVTVNRVVLGGNTLIDLTGDTVTPDTLSDGVVAHAASGEVIVGTYNGVAKTGDTMTGSLHTAPMDAGVCIHEAITKGTAPSATTYSSVYFSDNHTGTTGFSANCIGQVQHTMSTAGNSTTRLVALKNEAGSTSQAVLGVTYAADGTSYATAPTPAATSNTTHVATTKWVRDYIASLDASGVSY